MTQETGAPHMHTQTVFAHTACTPAEHTCAARITHPARTHMLRMLTHAHAHLVHRHTTCTPTSCTHATHMHAHKGYFF